MPGKTTKAQTPRAVRNRGSKARVLTLLRKTVALYAPMEGKTDATPMLSVLLKAAADTRKEGKSDQGVKKGRIPHPFNVKMVTEFKHANVHHSACIDAKVAASIGMGFDKDATAKKLNALSFGKPFKAALKPAIEDFWTNGFGYIEVKRDDNGNVIAFHYLPARDTYLFLENDGFSVHYEVVGNGTIVGSRHFAAFGDGEDMKVRAKSGNNFRLPNDKPPSEVVPIVNWSAMSRYYGFPDWLAAVASIELVQCIKQQQFDFFANRGVPEFMLFLLGGKVDDPDWKKIEDSIAATIGAGNQGKSVALNIWDENIKVQLEKLSLDGKTDGGAFGSQMETLSQDIVSAHRTPALIAGIRIPGKMGATNEAMNAIMFFQLLTIGPAQDTIQTALDCTLGNPDLNGDLGLSEGDFEFKKLTEEMDLGLGGKADTMSRMRTELPQANAEGRDLSDGLKKAAKGMTEEDVGELLGNIVLFLRKMREEADAA